MSSNIVQLQIHLKNMFNELLKTTSMKSHGKMAGEHMKQSVIGKVGSKYNQSGTMRRLLRTEVPIVQANKTGSKLNIGLGDIDEWNDETRRGPQRAVFTLANGGQKTVGLRPEPVLPAWIIMEFGRRPANTTAIPKDFQVPYTNRDSSKQFMFGPSNSYHFRKPVFFMTNQQGATPRTHPGVPAGRFFREGLKESQEEVNKIIGQGLEESMRELAIRYGGTVL
jgi:hypothetical protein